VVNLCKSLRETSVDVKLLDLLDSPDVENPDFVKSFPISGRPTRLGRSAGMKRWLNRAVNKNEVDIVHNHSLWMMPNVYACNAVRGKNVPLVVSPRGTLSQRAMDSGSRVKKIFWPLIQRPALNHVSCFHATAESEYEDIRRMGFDQPVAVIPNGVSIPGERARTKGGLRTLLFLGRLHPIKGIDNLLNAWADVSNQFPEWELKIIGPDNNGYQDDMERLAAELELQRVVFAGPLFGKDKTQAYVDADLYVLPTQSENFGMTVAESMAAGTPVIVTKGAPWGGVESRKAGWWVDIGKEPLAACLEQALSITRSNLDNMGLNGQRWMESDYSWISVATSMKSLYEWLLDRGSKPEFVYD
jgi:glycosyltransferase involved in cell wall biosynthesis